MSRRSRLFRFRLISGAGALVAFIAFFALPAQAGHAWTTCSDCYIVTPGTNPATAGAGTGEQYAFQVTNNDPHETLRSLTFTAPADFVVTGASGPSGTTLSSLPGSSVTLQLPSEPTGTTFAVTVTALAPCVAASSEAWRVSGVDSKGETNEVHWSASPLSVSVTGTCGLAFTGQPAQTAVNSDILTGFNSTGSPLAVQLLDANGDALNAADSAAATAVTVSIQANPGGGTLAGTTTVTSSAGVADFGNLQINKAGVGYELAANATGFTAATSNPFTVTGQIQACGNGSCSVSQSTSNTATSAATTAPGDFAALGLGGVSLSCRNYIGVGEVADFGIFNSAGNGVPTASAIATLTISKSALQSLPWLYRFFPRQVCYGSPTPFPTIPGTSGTTVVGGVTYHTGLLLSCFLVHRGPCLISRRYTPAGAVQLTFVANGDPIWHG